MIVLLGVTKIQILKVIHNSGVYTKTKLPVVGNHKDTNFESNSQLQAGYYPKIESCWKSQRYKF